MERAEPFTGMSGLGMMIMGALGMAASVATWHVEVGSPDWLGVWVAAALIALAVGGVSLVWKSLRIYGRDWRAPGNRFVFSLLPALFAGGLLSHALAPVAPELLPLVWLTCYGAGTFAAGFNSIRAISVMGALFLAGGLIVSLVPEAARWVLMTAFGGIHLGFGALIVVRHGG